MEIRYEIKAVNIKDRDIKREKELMKIEEKGILLLILSLTLKLNPIYLTSLHFLLIKYHT